MNRPKVGRRPIFHHKQARADGHLFITVLAYQFVQLISKNGAFGVPLANVCPRKWLTRRELRIGLSNLG
ncbi:hypothetical protein [Thiorhodococcus mannitoliphagus]|uniref:hypothetical protein n=1 Tax=Thiorhodococcus mannitoliphagus TaxID=329406 RepID=UPI001F116104|nr:hypothetical protein [Thiorhodococcus mannitoliphagus]